MEACRYKTIWARELKEDRCRIAKYWDKNWVVQVNEWVINFMWRSMNNPPKCTSKYCLQIINNLSDIANERGESEENNYNPFLEALKDAYQGSQKETHWIKTANLNSNAVGYLKDVLKQENSLHTEGWPTMHWDFFILDDVTIGYIRKNLQIGDDDLLRNAKRDEDKDEYESILLDILQCDFPEISCLDRKYRSIVSVHIQIFPNSNNTRRKP